MKPRYPRPRKRLGQNFLYDPAIAGRIAVAAGVVEGGLVVELGPGRGILTDALISRGARVVAVELDSELAGALAERTGDAAVTVIRADLAQTTIDELLEPTGEGRCVLVGNIPYYLTRDVLFGYLVDGRKRIERAVVMVQKEVGDRIASGPGSRVYGVTSVLLQSLYSVSMELRVAAGSFFPAPRVDSVVLGFVPREKALFAPGEFEPFRTLVRGVFGQRRKTMQNTMKSILGLSEEHVRQACACAGVDPANRPEQLDVHEFVALSRAIIDTGKGAGGTL